MNDLNIAFSRTFLSMTMEDVKKHTTVAERKAAWVYGFGRQSWEFHGPNDYYWNGRADNAYDARAKGWAAWLIDRGHRCG